MFSGKKSESSCAMLYSKICKLLSTDFLPPIEREDIASLAYSLYEISELAKVCGDNSKNSVCTEKIGEQLNSLESVSCGLLKKRNTCEEEIRRQIKINFECAELVSNNKSAENLNNSLRDFWKTAQNTFFKNI